MDDGQIIEEGTPEHFFDAPEHERHEAVPVENLVESTTKAHEPTRGYRSETSHAHSGAGGPVA
jgi:hypothetical protein